MQVACPSCSAEYPVNERRLPATGLKMRCPKCGARFHVHPDGRVVTNESATTSPGKRFARPARTERELPAAARPAPQVPSPGPAKPRVPKPAAEKPAADDFSLDLPAPKAAGPSPAKGRAAPATFDDFELDLPAPAAARRTGGDLELELPSTKAETKRPRPKRPAPDASEAPIGELDLDLPAPKPPGEKPPGRARQSLDLDLSTPATLPAGVGELDLDLPAPAKPATKQPIAPAFDDLDLDLPAPSKREPERSMARDLDLDLPAPKAAQAKKPIAPAFGDLDLPAPSGPAKKPGAPPFGDLDLPAPKAAEAKKPGAPPFGDLDLPAPKAAQAKKPVAPAFGDLDLPAPSGPAKKPGAPPFGDLDLPAPSGPAKKPGAPPFGDLDLPAPKAAQAKKPVAPPFGDLDLPAPSGPAKKPGAPPFGDLDLPPFEPAGSGPPTSGPFDDLDLDLPSPTTPRPASDVGSMPEPALAHEDRTPFDDLDLPAPRATTKSVVAEADEVFGELDLPMPKPAPSRSSGFGELDLPTPAGDAGAPAESFGDIDLPEPRGAAELPTLKGDGWDGLDLLEPRGGPAPDAFGELDLPEVRREPDLPAARGAEDLPVARPAAELGELELPTPEHPDTGGAARSGAVGGTSFGELDLGEPSDDMEFADIPQRSTAESSTPPGLAPGVDANAKRKKGAPAAPRAPKKGRAAWIVGALLVAVLGAGAALGLTPYGYFGVYFFDRFLPGAGDPSAVRAAIERAEAEARSDTWADTRESLRILAEARRHAGLNRALLARSLVHESLYQLRFGADSSSTSRASAIARRLDERGAEGPSVALGLAAHALARGDLSEARRQLAATQAHPQDDPYLALVRGELALAAGERDRAVEAFTRAAELGAGARGLWGAARAAQRDPASVERVLRESPVHEDALTAESERLLDEGDADAALALAEQVVGQAPRDGVELRAAPRTRALGWTVIGRVHEDRGRHTQALAAYDRALAAHDAHVPALLGAGRVLLGERPADAIARFDSVLQVQGARELVLGNGRTAVQEAQLGSARGNLALDRAQEAATTLGELAASRADDAEVLLWLGRAESRLDPPNHEAAEQHFRAAVSAAPERFAPYLALAELFFEIDRGEDAGAVLEQATARVAESAEMRLQLGEFELRRNRIPAAIRELTRALALDADLPAAHFALGVAYRRSGRLAEADRTFAHLAELDPGHPRLALERGLLFEARGEAERAVEAYREALVDDDGNLDLMLRLGAAQVAAEQIDDAEQTLQAVERARPSSAEAAHFVGRVAFARGRFAEALAHFRRASQIDPTRGEFHLYEAWAALENNQLGEALQGAETAIERDPSLGEAYWIRAVVRLRSGNPAGALPDLTRALELRPSFHQVHSALGDAHDQLGQLDQAIAAYERAVARVDDRGEWWWRLGRLRMDRGDRRGATAALARATLLGEATTPRPGWLAAAHRLHGNVLRLSGRRDDAITHYRRYLELAPPGDIDRSDVQQALADLGASGR